MIYKYPPLVEVLWLDAHSLDDWIDTQEKVEKERDSEMVVRSLGYMWIKDRGKVTLAMQIRGDGVMGTLMHIPRGCIKYIKKLGDYLPQEVKK